MADRAPVLAAIFACGLASTLLAAPAHGHDFWIEPSAFRPSVGQWVTVQLRIGTPFLGEPYPRTPDHLRRFEVIDDDGATTVPGRPGGEPAGIVHLVAPGPHVLVYESAASVAELDAARFAVFVEEVGLEDAARSGPSPPGLGRPVRDSFRRYAKALLQVGQLGAAGSPLHTRPLGLALELVPDTSPYAHRAGDHVAFRLLHRGAPVPGALVVASSARSARAPAAMRTDADGRVDLHLEAEGEWLLNAVRTEPATEGDGADWRSLWASLAFEMAAAPPAP